MPSNLLPNPRRENDTPNGVLHREPWRAQQGPQQQVPLRSSCTFPPCKISLPPEEERGAWSPLFSLLSERSWPVLEPGGLRWGHTPRTAAGATILTLRTNGIAAPVSFCRATQCTASNGRTRKGTASNLPLSSPAGSCWARPAFETERPCIHSGDSSYQRAVVSESVPPFS